MVTTRRDRDRSSPSSTTPGEFATSEQASLAPAAGPKLAPPPIPDGPELAPPDSDKEPLTGSRKNQEPAPGGPAGISISISEEEAPEPQSSQRIISASAPPALASSPAPAPITPATIPPTLSPVAPGSSLCATSRTRVRSPGHPDFRDVVPEDLKDTGRLLALYDQAIARGWVTASERDRLRFVSAAEHARVIGTKNPCGLFARLVRCGLWSFLTQDDEDVANVRLKRHLFGLPPERQASSKRAAPEFEELSEDAQLVQAIRAAVGRARYRGDAFPLLRREHPEWTSRALGPSFDGVRTVCSIWPPL